MDDVKQFWNRIAQSTTAFTQVHPCISDADFWGSGKPQADEVTRVCGRYAGGRRLFICDWGCGPGRVARHLACDGRHDVAGFDISENMLGLLKQHCPNVAAVNDVDIQRFDVIYSYSLLIHWDFTSGVAILNRMSRCLKAGGIIAAQAPVYRSRRNPQAFNDVGVWSVSDLSHALRLTGLALLEFSFNDQDFSYERPGPHHNALQVFKKVEQTT